MEHQPSSKSTTFICAGIAALAAASYVLYRIKNKTNKTAENPNNTRKEEIAEFHK